MYTYQRHIFNFNLRHFWLLLFFLAMHYNYLGAQIIPSAYDQASFHSYGDTLEIFYKKQVDSIRAFGPSPKWMEEIDDDVWRTFYIISNIDSLYLSMYFQLYEDGIPRFAQKPYDYIGNSIKKNSKVEEIAGQLDSVSIYSTFLDQKRRINYYLPPEHSYDKRYPVIYLADGAYGVVEHLSYYIEYLIIHDYIPELIVVGVEAGKDLNLPGEPYSLAKNMRTVEYLDKIHWLSDEDEDQIDTTRFDKHLNFFVSEVMAWAEDYISASSQREKIILRGSSNGASFSVSAAVKYPEKFGHIIAQSVAYNMYSLDNIDLHISGTPPLFHFVAGTLEKSYRNSTLAIVRKLRKNQTPYTYKEVYSGHFGVMWREEFINALLQIYSN